MKNLNIKKNKLILIGLSVVLIIILSTVKNFVPQNVNNDVNNNKNPIELKYSEDFSCFDNTMEDVALVLIQDLNNNNINVVSDFKYSGTDWADLYRYDIKLDNGDTIFFSSNEEDTIERIIYRGNVNDLKYTGKFIGTIARLYIKDLDGESFENEINNNFTTEDNLSKMFGESYVYSHIKFEWFRASSDEFYDITFSVVPDENHQQYKERIEREEKEKAEIEAKEKEEREKQEQEEQKKLKEKERIFTAGTYKVGRDIESGVYNMIAVSGRGNCFVDSKTNVIETFKPGGDNYAIPRYNNVELSDGGVIEVKGTLKIKFEPVS